MPEKPKSKRPTRANSEGGPAAKKADKHSGIDKSSGKQTGGRPRVDAETAASVTDMSLSEGGFGIVGVGASAGGLDALKAFFSTVPADSGAAYVVVVHLTPKQPSILSELLQRVALIPVVTAEEGLRVEPNHAYVIPPGKELSIQGGKLHLQDRQDSIRSLPFDSLLRSLAADHGRLSAAVVLSGTGTDGTAGLRDIKSHDGLVLAQSEESAEYRGMPASAVDTGLVDMILPPEQMPETIIRYFQHSVSTEERELEEAPSKETEEQRREWLETVFGILRKRLGHDFSAYKQSTLRRRIARRMGLKRISTYKEYAQLLQDEPEETAALFRELLIGVTSFFRDPESFEALKQKALPDLMRGIPDGATFRAWVPGCSTGEEVFSLAIVLREFLETLPRHISFQIFGTDVNEFAIERARQGLFPANVAADVTEERLKRYFTREGDGFRVNREVRDDVVFAVQDVLRDPPFAHLNLLCCRNLLIYLGAEAQKKLLPLFHYTLAEGGVLMLGSAETIGDRSNLFATIDSKNKLYRRLEVPRTALQIIEFPTGPATHRPGVRESPPVPVAGARPNYGGIVHQALLGRFAPPSVLVDTNFDILHVEGRVGKYLEQPGGPPTDNVVDLAKRGLGLELSSALRTAQSKRSEVVRHGVVVDTNGKQEAIDLYVRPVATADWPAGGFLVSFEEVEPAPEAQGTEPGEDASVKMKSRINELEEELQFARDDHQVVIEELESSNEELKSTNEELQSSNEELQSTNEELESSREELQSLNEELQTINAELRTKVEELSAAHDDMRNLLSSARVGTIFVDSDRRIKRFTKEATEIVNLIDSDIGRPLGHVVDNLRYKGLMEDLNEVIETLVPRQADVQTTDGRWYSMRIVPYRTTDNRIEGAVLTFFDIGERKRTERELADLNKQSESSRNLIRAVFDMGADPLLVLDGDDRIVIANKAFGGVFRVHVSDVEGRVARDVIRMSTGSNDLLSRLAGAEERGQEFGVGVEGPTVNVDGTTYAVEGRIIHEAEGSPYRILLRFVRRGVTE